MSAQLLERAWVGGRVRTDVLVTIEDGRFTGVWPEAAPAPTATRVPGLTLPGLANTHSHAFHRALRSRTQDGRGSFWSWRERMYAVADRLDPDAYFRLARATYAEMAAAGFTTVGEFHYLHHPRGGGRYDDPNAMGQALIAAARDVGLRITLLDACYLAGGFGEPLGALQRRFGDGDGAAWRTRVEELRDAVRASADDGVTVGAAVHSVRAVPPEEMVHVTGFAGPVHAHLSEQPAENEACRAALGRTPAEVFAEAGLLESSFTAVHATHLTEHDLVLLGGAGVGISLCPTTERDLGDGIGPARRLVDAGAVLGLGSDSQAVIDPFEEMRAAEMDERLGSRHRGRFSAAELLTAAARHDLLGLTDAGAIAVGNRADLVTLDTASPRTAGCGRGEHMAVFAAASADVTRVMIDGRLVFDGDHAGLGRELEETMEEIWR